MEEAGVVLRVKTLDNSELQVRLPRGGTVLQLKEEIDKVSRRSEAAIETADSCLTPAAHIPGPSAQKQRLARLSK